MKPLLCDCGHPPTEDNSNSQFQTLGYARDNETGETVCYACCAELDRETLRTGDRWAGYVTENTGTPEGYVSNWPGSLKIPVNRRQTHKVWNCFAGRKINRTDVWFTFEGRSWWGVNQGDNQIIRCKLIKGGKR